MGGYPCVRIPQVYLTSAGKLTCRWMHLHKEEKSLIDLADPGCNAFNHESVVSV